MNEEDRKLLELYLKDIRKKRIIFIIIIALISVSILFYIVHNKYKHNSNEKYSLIQGVTQFDIIDENNTNEENEYNTEETISIKKQENTDEISKENTNKEIKNNTKENLQIQNVSINRKEKNTNAKPTNKDFLFSDGYTMDNVTQAAQNYLKSYNYSGECIPIKDNEGVYIGMRVVFY